jgi:hypothetical protein
VTTSDGSRGWACMGLQQATLLAALDVYKTAWVEKDAARILTIVTALWHPPSRRCDKAACVGDQTTTSDEWADTLHDTPACVWSGSVRQTGMFVKVLPMAHGRDSVGRERKYSWSRIIPVRMWVLTVPRGCRSVAAISLGLKPE